MKVLTTLIVTLILNQMILARTFGKELGDWKIEKGSTGYYLIKKDLEPKMIKVRTIGGTPKVVNVIHKKELPDQYVLVIYQGGSAGTSDIVTVYRAILYNLKENKFVKDLPYRYESQNKKVIPQPEWDISKTSIKVKDPNNGKKEEVSLF